LIGRKNGLFASVSAGRIIVTRIPATLGPIRAEPVETA